MLCNLNLKTTTFLKPCSIIESYFWDIPFSMALATYLFGILFLPSKLDNLIDTVWQGDCTPLQSVLLVVITVKIKVNSQLEIFSIINSQTTITL